MDHNGQQQLRQRQSAVHARAAACAFCGLLALSCSAEDMFRAGRVEEPCSAVYPTCHAGFAAGCYLSRDNFAAGQLPGARRVLVTTSLVNQTIRVRMFFKNMLFPGTEILVQAYEPDCGDVSRDLREDVDVFEEAGDDSTLIFDLAAATPGDHLVEIYSDCAADYLLTAEPMGGAGL